MVAVISAWDVGLVNAKAQLKPLEMTRQWNRTMAPTGTSAVTMALFAEDLATSRNILLTQMFGLTSQPSSGSPTK